MELIQIVVDSGLFVLVWLVQLVIYPGFRYYSEVDMKRWHQPYSKRMTIIVLPLMVSQLLVYCYLNIKDVSVQSLFTLLLVISTWIITFRLAVPLHQEIDLSVDSNASIVKLVRVNWIRTAIWTFVFILNLLNYAD
ncbi:MAG: hypothetical protein HKN87_06390 [Saprospiraceae bacterium]|nr:hypothetical protein [Saprospiraceae bacterium]